MSWNLSRFRPMWADNRPGRPGVLGCEPVPNSTPVGRVLSSAVRRLTMVDVWGVCVPGIFVAGHQTGVNSRRKH